MSLLPRLPPNFDAALRDVRASGPDFRLEAAVRLSDAPEGREAEAREGLRVLLDDRWAPVRQAALVGLGVVGDAESLARVRAAVSDPHVGVREAAVEALARLGREAVAQELVGLLESDRAEVRFQAVRGLAALDDPDARDALATRLDDPDAHVRAEVVSALGESGELARAEAIATRLRDASELVRSVAAFALASLDDTRAIGPLRHELVRGRRRAEAAHALAHLSATQARDDLAALATRFFAPAYDRVAAAHALLSLGDTRGIEALARVLRSPFGAGKDEALECVGTLGIVELLPELARVAERRAVDPARLEDTLARLAVLSPDAAALRRRLRTASS